MRSAPPIELHSQAILAVVGLAERVAEWRGLVLTPGDAACLSGGTLLSRSSRHRRSAGCIESGEVWYQHQATQLASQAVLYFREAVCTDVEYGALSSSGHCLIGHHISCCRFGVDALLFMKAHSKEEYMQNAACACPSEIDGDFRRTRSSQEYCALHRNSFICL